MFFSTFRELCHRAAQRITKKDHKKNRRLCEALCSLRAASYNSQNLLVFILIPAVILFQPLSSAAQDFSRTINKSAQFANSSDAGNTFRIMNINGSVNIEAYGGDTIELTVNEQINGSDSDIEQAKRELNYKLERRGNLILAYLDAPFITIKVNDSGEVHYRIDRDSDDYEFIHNVQVKVPRGILLDGSTINKGDLTISGTFKEVEASNVNGGLNLRHLTSKTCANTVNGDITISYDRPPDQDSEYHTVNGTIKVFMPQNLSADIYFKSMHGDLYTDFDNTKRLEPKIKKQTHSSRSKITYQVEKFSPLRIGNGGTKLRFEVLNGDVYIRKKS